MLAYLLTVNFRPLVGALGASLHFTALHPAAAQLPALRIAADSATLETTDGEPFLWLGDTAWELLHRLDSAEVRRYLDARAAQGVNLVQTVGLAELEGLTIPNANGDLPLVDLDPARLNEPYWAYVDWVLGELADREMYAGFLPTWGDKFNLAWGVGPEVFTPANAEAFARALGERYADRSHLVWVLGGDRWPEDDEDRAIIEATARGLLAGGAEQLITYHPNGARRATEYFDADWLDFDMFQTGHDRRQLDFAYVRASREGSARRRPVVNAEPRYEDHPDRFDQTAHEWMGAADVRQAAYWTFLAGGAGFTYGSHDTWQMWAPGRDAINGARRAWWAALQLPGAEQLRHVRTLLAATGWPQWRPAANVLAVDSVDVAAPAFLAGAQPTPGLPAAGARGTLADSVRTLAVVAGDGELVVAFTPYGHPVRLLRERLPEPLRAAEPEALWFNPRDGTVVPTQAAGEAPAGELTYAPWSRGWGSDFVLVVGTAEALAGVRDGLTEALQPSR